MKFNSITMFSFIKVSCLLLININGYATTPHNSPSLPTHIHHLQLLQLQLVSRKRSLHRLRCHLQNLHLLGRAPVASHAIPLASSPPSEAATAKTVKYKRTCQTLTCHYSCVTCNNTVTQCTSFSSANKRVFLSNNNTCPCIERYFDDGSSADCGTCHYTCTTCSGTA